MIKKTNTYTSDNINLDLFNLSNWNTKFLVPHISALDFIY